MNLNVLLRKLRGKKNERGYFWVMLPIAGISIPFFFFFYLLLALAARVVLCGLAGSCDPTGISILFFFFVLFSTMDVQSTFFQKVKKSRKIPVLDTSST